MAQAQSVTIVLGAQFGDEGKGKLTDILAHSAQLCCRAAGGNNAGHTIVANGTTYDFHILPRYVCPFSYEEQYIPFLYPLSAEFRFAYSLWRVFLFRTPHPTHLNIITRYT